jgi:ethanolamine utilization microcompartment shell protein EutS
VAVPGLDLRAFGMVSRMQPRYAAYEATVADGDIPLAGMAQLFLELAPGNEIYRLADAALKATTVRPGSQVVEREFGLLALHADDPQVVVEAGRVMLERLGMTAADRLCPTIVSENVISNITPFQAQLINRFRKGSLLVPHSTLLVLEVTPAAYIMLAANEAERAADIDIIDVRPVGRFGRLYISGDESNVREAQAGARRALESLDGRAADRREGARS